MSSSASDNDESVQGDKSPQISYSSGYESSSGDEKKNAAADKALVKKRKANAFIDAEASESDDGSGSNDDDDDDEDEGSDLEGFVVSDEEEGGKSSSRRKRKKKDRPLKRLKQKDDGALDEEDLRLIQENLGFGGSGPSPSDEDSDAEPPVSSSRVKKKSEMARQMFGDDSDDDDDLVPHRPVLKDIEYESDDMDEFIVDDDGTKKNARRKKPSAIMLGPSAYQMDEAEELFGAMDDFIAPGKNPKPRPETLDDSDDEGSDTGSLRSRATRSSAPSTSRTAALLSQYEPSQLADFMLTAADDKVRATDMPERYQHAYADRVLPLEFERSAEAEWIVERIFETLPTTHTATTSGTSVATKRGEVLVAIETVLRLFHEDVLEPAVVITYRPECWKTAGLTEQAIRTMAELDTSYAKLDRKKKSLSAHVMASETRATGGQDADYGLTKITSGMYRVNIAMADEAHCRDLSEFFALDMDDAASASLATSHRAPIRRDFFRQCRKAELQTLTRLFCLPARVLGSLLVGTRRLDDPDCQLPTPTGMPLAVAAAFTSSRFLLPVDALKGASHIAACEVAFDPDVKSACRTLYQARVVLDVTTTAKGREDIDTFHYVHGWQYLEGAPVAALAASHPTILLKLVRAEKEGYVTLTYRLPSPQVLQLSLTPLYAREAMTSTSTTLSSENALAAAGWHSLRLEIINEAVVRFLIPTLQREYQTSLCQLGRAAVLSECCDALTSRLDVRPYAPRDGTSVEVHAIGVWVNNKGRDSTITLVAVDANGLLKDTCTHRVDREPACVAALSDIVVAFITAQTAVHVMVINTSSGPKCLDAGELVDGARRRLNRFDNARFGQDDGRDYIHITFLLDDVARVYASSERGATEFPEQPMTVKAAVSLARSIQNPLSEYCGLWQLLPLGAPSRGDALCHLQLSPNQRFVTKAALVAGYDQVFCTAVTAAGIDLNLAARASHASYGLQFVPGLGPVSAEALLTKCRTSGVVESREELKSARFLAPRIYRNAAPYLRIRERDVLREVNVNPLDDTRIHPSDYPMAVKMCGDSNNRPTLDVLDVMSYGPVVEDTMFQSVNAIKLATAARSDSGLAIPEHAMVPEADIDDSLAELDLVAYAHRLELEKKGQKRLVLEHLKQELRYPYFDTRQAHVEPSEEDLLYLMNGETRTTFAMGMILPCRLVSKYKFFCRTILSNGVRSSLRTEMLPDHLVNREDGDFDVDTIVNAKLLGFRSDNYGRHMVVLGCNDSSIQDVSMCFHRSAMSSYATIHLIERDSRARLKACLNTPHVLAPPRSTSSHARRKKRQISHPSFQNIDCKKAVAALKDPDVEVGDAIFRPSSLGTDHLTLTWKLSQEVYRHFDIVEMGKSSDAKLGARLLIKNEEFEDLDELLARFIAPMNDYILDVTSHDKFFHGSDEALATLLVAQKKASPKSIPYQLALSAKHPGSVAIHYVASRSVHRRYFDIRSNGYRFYGTMESPVLGNVKQVLNFFKSNAFKVRGGNNSTNGSVSSRGSAAPRAPPRGPMVHPDRRHQVPSGGPMVHPDRRHQVPSSGSSQHRSSRMAVSQSPSRHSSSHRYSGRH